MAVVRTLGKLLISVGVGVLLFVAWVLWGTGIATGRAQDRLAEEFDRQQSFAPVTDDSGASVAGPPDSYSPGPGEAVFRLVIPRIDLRQMVVQGVSADDLALGPGHYPECGRAFEPPLCTPAEEVWPGQRGRVIISGHRTTHGAPFWALDKLSGGDEILFETRWGSFTYEVTDREIVSPQNADIADPVSDASEIVLTTCNPRFSAGERLIVFATLTESTLPGEATS